MRVTVILAGLVVVLAAGSLAFAIQPGLDTSPDPVPFSDTLATGMTGVDVQKSQAAGDVIPRVEVFFSQYQYVVGYYGIESAVRALKQERTTRQFGYAQTVYVTDFAGAQPRVGSDGHLTVASDPEVGWVSARAAHFVVDSEARTFGGKAIVPFGERAAARAFADRYGGTVIRWDELEVSDEAAVEGTVRERIDDRREWANQTVSARQSLRNRPVSVVVGEDAPTLEAALDRAPPNTTVRVPPGTYDGNVTIEKPVTIDGAGEQTILRGDGDGSVLEVRARETALLDLSISGVGENNTGSPSNRTRTNGTWDEAVRTTYGYGDAGIVLDGANRSLLEDVTVRTPASGAIIRASENTVVRESTIEGTDTWQDGFMSVLAMNSRIVVEDSTFEGGRDGVYTHHAHGLVVRDNRMTGMRFGVHEMYTSDALIANNTVSEANIGIVVMTRPRSNALVENRVSDSGVGISMSGSASAAIENVVRNNRYGMDLGTQRSVFAQNVIVANNVGLRTGTIVPTNRVRENDVIENDRYATTGRGPARIWSGNYWGTIPGRDRDEDGTIDRPFRPTGVVDGVVGAGDGPATLAQSPAVGALRRFQAAVPGLRRATVVDDRPRSAPANPAAVAQATNGTALERGENDR